MAVRNQLRTQEEVQKHFCPKLKERSAIYRKAQTAYLRKAKLGEVIKTILDGKVETTNTVKDDNSWIVCAKTSFGEQYIITADSFESSYDIDSAKPIKISSDADNKEHLKKLQDAGFQEYNSKRSVYAKEVDYDDIAWLLLTTRIDEEDEVEEDEDEIESEDENDNSDSTLEYDHHHEEQQEGQASEAYFIAPWGESMRVECGDVLVMQYVDDDNVDDEKPVNEEVYRIEKTAFSETYREKSK